MKHIIKLTESDLHSLIKESVNRILSEIQYRGESFHGDNPDDWRAMADLRYSIGDANKYIYDYGTGKGTGQYDDKFLDQGNVHRNKGIDDYLNAASFKLSGKDRRQSVRNGLKKSNRIKKGVTDRFDNKKVF